MADQNPYRQAREVENDALGRMTGPSPKEVGWDEGFAAGRAAATPDPHDWSAAILTLRQAMCTPAGREQVERELLRPFAASPDERLREAAERLTRAVEVLDLSDPRLDDAGPYETLTVPQSAAAWRDIRRFVAEARSALAAADREKPEPSGCCRVCGGSGHVGDGCHGCAPPVSDDPVNDPETNT